MVPAGKLLSTEQFNGTSWSTTAYNMGISAYGHGACGSQNNALAFGGYSGSSPVGTTQKFVGASNFGSYVIR